MNQPRTRTCTNCGAPIDHETQVYVGGRGYVYRPLCRDEVTCWARYDLAHGRTAATSVALRALHDNASASA